jgi:hypothetical protein
VKEIDWNAVAEHLQDAAAQYAEYGNEAAEKGDRDAKIVFTLTGGICSILACALWDGLGHNVEEDNP